MAILNYTTSVPAERTCQEIQKILVKAKANAVLFDYSGDSLLTSISFRINTEHGEIGFKLPSNAKAVLMVMQNDKAIKNTSKTPEHAQRVAWRIVKDWVEAQLAIIEAGMATLPQVFLPYAQTPQGTVYECFERNGAQFLLGKE